MVKTDGNDEPTPASAPSEPGADTAPGSGRESGKERGEEGFDLKGIVRQLTAPMIESLDTRLREQIEAHADDVLHAKVDDAVADRLSTVDRAIADLSRSLEELERRLGSLEREYRDTPDQ